MHRLQAKSAADRKFPGKAKKLLPFLCVCLANVVWGFSFLFTRVALLAGTPDLMLAHRFLIATLVMLLLIATGKQKVSFRGKPWKPALLLMAMQIAYYVFESYGILYTNATISGMILAVVPVVTIGTGALFLKEYPTLRQGLFCVVPVIGVILMSVSGSDLGVAQPLGLFFLLLTCLSSAFYNTANRRAGEDFTPFERTFLVLSCSAVIFAFTGLNSVGWNMEEFLLPFGRMDYLLPVLALSILSSIVATMLFNFASTRMSVFQISSFGALSTLISVFAGVIFLREPMNFSMFLGAVLILVGIREVTRN